MIDTKHNITSNFATLIFGIVVFIPSLTFVILNQSSYASGIFISSTLILFFVLLKKHTFDIYTFKSNLKTCFILSLLITFHGIISFFITHQLNTSRFLGSLLLLNIMLLASYAFILLLNKTTNKVITKSLTFILYLLLLISLSGGIFSYIPLAQYATLNKPIFPFMEPSHFSLIIAPFYLWAIVTRKFFFHKILLIAYGFIVLLFVSNLTLMCVIFLGVFLTFGVKRLILIMPIFIFLISISNFDLSYYSKRVDVEDKNISTLVWLQGWEEAYIDLKNTYGMGIGFQQFGVNDPQGDAANAILYLVKDYMNRYDGGTFTSKVLGEFGFLGVIIILLFLKKIYKSYLFLKNAEIYSIEKNAHLLFYHCCIFYFVIELFVRSMSYISPGLFMFLVGVIGIHLNTLSLKQPILNNGILIK